MTQPKKLWERLRDLAPPPVSVWMSDAKPTASVPVIVLSPGLLRQFEEEALALEFSRAGALGAMEDWRKLVDEWINVACAMAFDQGMAMEAAAVLVDPDEERCAPDVCPHNHSSYYDRSCCEAAVRSRLARILRGQP